MSNVRFETTRVFRPILPGPLFEERGDTQPMGSKTPAEVAKTIPERAFAFDVFEEQTAMFPWPDGESQKVTRIKGERRRYYPGGRVLDEEAAVEEFGADSAVVSNLRGWRDYDHVVITRLGNVTFFNPETDEVL